MTREDLINISKNTTEEEYNSFYKGYSESVSKQIEYVYMDLTYLQDIYLGGILNMTGDDEVYPYILSMMDRYNERCTDNYLSYFPDLNIKEEDLFNYVRANSKLLLRTSPPTNVLKHMYQIHRNYLMDNKYKIGMNDPIRKLTYIINTYPLSLEKEDMLFLKQRVIDVIKDPVINFGVISKPSNGLSMDTYKKFNVWYISDLGSWSNVNCNAYKAMYVSLYLRNSTVYMEPRITNPEILDNLSKLTEDGLRSLEQNTILSLNCFADVNYLRSSVLIKK